MMFSDTHEVRIYSCITQKRGCMLLGALTAGEWGTAAIRHHFNFKYITESHVILSGSFVILTESLNRDNPYVQ